MGNFCQQVLELLGSNTQVFTVLRSCTTEYFLSMMMNFLDWQNLRTLQLVNLTKYTSLRPHLK